MKTLRPAQLCGRGVFSKNIAFTAFYYGSVAYFLFCLYDEGRKEGAVMYAIDKKQFGAFVSELRKEKGYTQKELAGRLFVSDKAVSKWETGSSIPDTALLIPLAEQLGVTVTELLLCHRSETESLSRAEAEQAVQAAIGYENSPAARIWQTRSKVLIWYLAALVAAAAGSIVTIKCGYGNWDYFTYIGLYIFFGGYFCLFALQTLPEIYDKAKISFLSDGILRMNVPGVHFSNRNWPHILRAGQAWGISSLFLFPWLYLTLRLLSVPTAAVMYICIGLTLGGLFIPMYIVGKKYK